MSTGQILLSLAALMLLSVTVLNVNRNFGQVDNTLNQDKSRLEALSLLSSYVERTSQYLFDEAVADTGVGKDLADFVKPNELGPDGDDAGIIDDFDDFHGQVLSDTARSGVIYNIAFDVNYVKLVGKDILKDATNKTYHKRMMICVYDSYDPPFIYKVQNGKQVKDTLKVSFIRSYWFFN